jgi:ABC-type amino acid transport substrate-binding protein
MQFRANARQSILNCLTAIDAHDCDVESFMYHAETSSTSIILTMRSTSVCAMGSRILAMVAMMAAASSVHADTLKKIRESSTIVLAHRESSVPFSYVTAQKEPVGYSLDLCAKIVEAVKRDLKLSKLKVTYLQVAAGERLAAIKDSKADIECGNTTNTPARRNDVDFAITTFVAGGRALGVKPFAPSDITQFRAATIAVAQNSTYEKLLKDQNEKFGAGIKIMSMKDNAEAFAAVEAGKSQGWISDDTILYATRAQSSQPDRYAISDRVLTIEPLALMLRKDDAAFKSLVNTEIRRLMSSGEFTAIYTKWFQAPIPPKNVNLNIPVSRLLKEFMTLPSESLPYGY